MDIRQALIDFLEAVAARDVDTIDELGPAIGQWVAQGGFIPSEIRAARDALKAA